MLELIHTNLIQKIHSLSFFSLVLLGGLSLLPFIHNASAQIPYEIPRVYFFYGWSVILFCVALVQKRVAPKGQLVWWLGLYMLIAILASVVGVNPLKSLQGNFYRRDGLLTLYFCMTFAWAIALGWRENLGNAIVKTIAFTTILLALIIVGQGLQLQFLTSSIIANWNGDIGWIFGNPNFLAGYLLVSAPLTLLGARLLSPKKISLHAMVWALLGSALYFTHSRASMLLFAAFAAYSISERFSRNIKFTIACTLIVCGAFISWKIMAHDTGDMMLTMVAESRERIYRKMLLGWLERPMLGYGWANADAAFSAAVWPYPMRFDVYVDKAHGHMLEHLVTTGIMGYIAYLLIIISMFKTFLRQGVRSFGESKQFWMTLLATFGLFLLHSQTNVISIAQEMYFWLIVGILLSAKNRYA